MGEYDHNTHLMALIYVLVLICITHMHREMMGKWVMSLQSEGTY